jgi:hypothetical protein
MSDIPPFEFLGDLEFKLNINDQENPEIYIFPGCTLLK